MLADRPAPAMLDRPVLRPPVRPAAAARLPRRALVAGGGAAAALALVAAAPGAPVRAAAVTFGLTPVFLDSDIQLIAQLEAYLSEHVARRVQLVKRRTYQEITSMLLAGQLDAAWICGFPFVQHPQALRILAVPLYRGDPLYRAYLLAAAGRAATRLADLRGDIHAFSDPDSNSGYLVTRAGLAQMNAEPAAFFRRTFFTYGHRNVIRAVASGLAQSGSVDGYVWDVIAEIEPRLAAATQVIARSEPMGFPPVVAPAAAQASAAAAIGEALIAMPRSALGRTILATLRLDGFTSAGPALYRGIEALARRARGVG